MTFTQYVDMVMNKTSSVTPDVQSKKIENEKIIEQITAEANPKVWTGKVVKNIKYIIFDGKFLNADNLKKEISDLYVSKGFGNFGFSKLSVEELVRYETVKEIMKKIFKGEITDEVKASDVAKLLFDREIKDYV